MSLVGIFVIVAFLLLVFGWWYPSTRPSDAPGPGYVGWSPLGILIILFLILLLTGNISIR